MFFTAAACRELLSTWTRELLDDLTPASPDRRALHEITCAEVLDLAYLEGTELSDAVAAHALYPVWADDPESGRGSFPSSMEAVFPIQPADEGARPCELCITARWGQPA